MFTCGVPSSERTAQRGRMEVYLGRRWTKVQARDGFIKERWKQYSILSTAVRVEVYKFYE
jgi:hypothetical protein